MPVSIIYIDGIEIKLSRKRMKTLRLSVCSTLGEVRLSVPYWFPRSEINQFLDSRRDWIKKNHLKALNQPKAKRLTIKTGELHWFQGKTYPLIVSEGATVNLITLKEGAIQLDFKSNLTLEDKTKLLNDWYRSQFKRLLPELLSKWQPIVKQTANEYRIKKMKTLWGSCNINDKRIWLNLELIKKPLSCIEYVLVHELVHLYEKHHNARFKAYMSEFMPDWQLHQKRLESQ